ncbi:MAG: preprotein translocase subunit SecG [Lentisphaeria bacterium]|jgi:preprotein translocase subunit SecG
MEFLSNLLTVIVVITAFLLIGIVLIQPSKSGGGLGAMSGGATESVLGAAAGTVLTRATVILAAIFMGLTLILVVINAHRRGGSGSVVEELKPAAASRSQETITLPLPEPVKPAAETPVTADPPAPAAP